MINDMRLKYIILSAFALLTACTNDDNLSSNREAFLQIETEPLPATRAVVDKTAFSDSDTITLYVEEGGQTTYAHVGAERKNGQWVLDRKVKITTEQADVYALLGPLGTTLYEGMDVRVENSIWDGRPQYEILYGQTVSPVSYNDARAHLQFRYALSRLTFRFSRQALTAEGDLTVESLSLRNTDGLVVVNRGTIDRYGKIKPYDDSAQYYISSKGTVIPKDSYYDFDLLTIPTAETAGSRNAKLSVEFAVGNNYSSAEILLTNIEWQRNTHYTYNIEFADDGSLRLVDVAVTPRTAEEMDPVNLLSESTAGAQGNLTVGGTVGTPVDLGLSVYWSDHDMGVSSETEYKYFYWGDPTGAGTYSTVYVPYCYDICGTKYDIATAQWGGFWRMPSRDELQELVDNTTHTVVTRNGIIGMLFTSKVSGYTGRSIFIPTDYTYQGRRYGYVLAGTRRESTGFWVDILEIMNENPNSPDYLTFVTASGYSNATTPRPVNDQIRPVMEKR